MTTKDYASNREGPLSQLRVIDMTRLAAGNMLTHMLADFGAEVIKIERPGVGDDLRRFGKRETWWKVYARSKKSVTLNPRSDEGRAILLELVETADVLVENFVPGTLEKWGMGPDTLWRHRSDLVIVRVTGWGQTGPYSDKPGFGSLIEGMSGLAAMSGFPDRPPLLPPLALADMIAGLSGFGAVMVAINARLTGLCAGQIIDLTLFEPLFGVLGPLAASYSATGDVPKRQGNTSPIAAPRNIYECADGRFLALSASMQSMWEKLARAIGRPELIEDPRFLTNELRVENNDVLDTIVADAMAKRTLSDNLDHFGKSGVTVGPICDIADLIDHPFITGRGVLETYPDADLGAVPMHAVFPRLSETPGVVRAPAPRLGEHNRAIFGELGISEDRQQSLAERGVI